MEKENEGPSGGAIPIPIRGERLILIGTEVAGNNADIKKLIECPVCFEIPLPPIYLCREGHIVCNSCQCRTTLCPLCRGEYSNTRSFFAEEMIQRCSLKCRFADQGCPVFKKGSLISRHQLNCEFRPYKCLQCNGKAIDYTDYQDHLENFHHCPGRTGRHAFVILALDMTKTLYEQRIYDWPQFYLKCHDQFFVFRIFGTYSFVNAWLCLVGDQSDCCKYEVKISLKLPHSASGFTRINWVGSVRHFRETPSDDIYLGGGCLSVPIDLIRNAFQTATIAEWVYLIQVKERKNPGDDLNIEGTEAEANEVEGTGFDDPEIDDGTEEVERIEVEVPDVEERNLQPAEGSQISSLENDQDQDNGPSTSTSTSTARMTLLPSSFNLDI